MQARVSRSQQGSQEVVGRGTTSSNKREDPILVTADCRSSLPNHPVESATPSELSNGQSGALLELSLARRLTQIATTMQPDIALFEVAQVLSETFEADGCILSVQATSNTSEQIAYWFSEQGIAATSLSELLSKHQGIGTAFPENTDVLVIPELRLSDDLSDPTLPRRTVMSITTQCQGQINGAISILRSTHSPDRGAWSDIEVTLLKHAANQVAVTISQVLLQQRVYRQSQYQALLRQVTSSIQNSTDLPQVVELAIHGAAQALQAERAFLLRLKYWDPRHTLRIPNITPKARVIIDRAWQQESLQGPAHPTIDPTEASSEEAPSSQSFWVSDCLVCQAAMESPTKGLTLAQKSDFPSPTDTAGIASIFNPDEMASLMLVPLESKHRLLGFVVLQQRQPRVWHREEVEVMELVAAQISSAILQSETLRQVEMLVEERTAQLQNSLEVQAKLYEITRKQIEKLREMNRRMDEFLSTLSHELRTPLTSMMLAIRMLREVNLTPDRRQQYLNILEQQCAQETNLINDLLALQELETKQVAFQLQPVDLNHGVQDLVQSFYQRWASKGIELNLDLPKRSPLFNTDVASFNRILLELLNNAGKYSEPSSTVFLKVALQQGQQIQIMLSNVGSGISEEELPHIFDKFRRCQGMTQNAVPGTGLGLALVKSLVQHLNGTIEATSIAIAGTSSYETCFTVTLPQNVEIGE